MENGDASIGPLLFSFHLHKDSMNIYVTITDPPIYWAMLANYIQRMYGLWNSEN